MSDLEVSVTICSWNTQADLRTCLASLEAVRAEARFEVIVVDNNSQDGSPDMVEREFPWVRLFRMAKNLGFTGGHNYALDQRKAPHAFLLNSDAAVHRNALRILIDYANGHPHVGVVGPRILNPDGSLQLSCRRFPYPIAALFRNTWLGRLFPKNRYLREYLMTDWDHDSPREVDWVSGAAMFVTKQFMDKVGYLDPEFFMFCEDVDWCWRARDAGFRVVYLPIAEVTHAIGRSTDQAPNRMIIRFHRSMFRFYTKNMLQEASWYTRPFKWLAAGVALWTRAGIFIVKNKFRLLLRKVKR